MLLVLYDNEYALIINIYFYEYFSSFLILNACIPKSSKTHLKF
jgi:hypothetical protein